MQEWTVSPGEEGRLDRFLLSRLPWLATGRLHKYVRENKIKVDGRKLPLEAFVAPGSTVRLYEETAPLPPLLLTPAQESGVPAGLSRPQLLAALVEEGALRPGQIAIGTPQRGEAAGILNFLETGRPGA